MDYDKERQIKEAEEEWYRHHYLTRDQSLHSLIAKYPDKLKIFCLQYQDDLQFIECQENITLGKHEVYGRMWEYAFSYSASTDQNRHRIDIDDFRLSIICPHFKGYHKVLMLTQPDRQIMVYDRLPAIMRLRYPLILLSTDIFHKFLQWIDWHHAWIQYQLENKANLV